MESITVKILPKFSSLSLISPYNCALNTTIPYLLKCGFCLKRKDTYYHNPPAICDKSEELVLIPSTGTLQARCGLLNIDRTCKICRTF